MPIDLGKNGGVLSLGGFGSGRSEYDYFDTRPEMEECEVISATELYQDDQLEKGKGNLQLDYEVYDRKIAYRVPVEWTECNFGGFRPWFRCPGIVDGEECNRRVEKIYRPPKNTHFLCRHCHDVTYRSSNVSGNPWKTAGLKMRKIEEKLAKKAKSDDYNPKGLGKPKDMHWQTYFELMEKYNKLEMRFHMGIRADIPDY